MVVCWERLPEEVVESPSLEHFKRSLDKNLSGMVELALLYLPLGRKMDWLTSWSLYQPYVLWFSESFFFHFLSYNSSWAYFLEKASQRSLKFHFLHDMVFAYWLFFYAVEPFMYLCKCQHGSICVYPLSRLQVRGVGVSPGKEVNWRRKWSCRYKDGKQKLTEQNWEGEEDF